MEEKGTNIRLVNSQGKLALKTLQRMLAQPGIAISRHFASIDQRLCKRWHARSTKQQAGLTRLDSLQ